MQETSRRGFIKAAGVMTLGAHGVIAATHMVTSDATGKLPWQLGAVKLAAAIRERTFSSTHVVKSYLQRIEAVNPKVNAITVVLRDSALRSAERVDRLVEQGEMRTDQPLLGVPFTIKENIDVLGSETTEGVVAEIHEVARDDAPHVAQLRAAGAIPIARTNMPDLGLRWHTDSSLRGVTLNPWNQSVTPGGSSGGEAVALATGMSPLGLGNDYGGSMRFPAQCCGVSSIRPSRGRVAAVHPPDSLPLTLGLFAVEGPMARQIADLRLALRSMSGPDRRDPWWSPTTFDGPKLKRPIRIAVASDPGKSGVHADVRRGVMKAADALSNVDGYVVEDADPPNVLEAWELWCRLVTADIRELMWDDIKNRTGKDGIHMLGTFLARRPNAEASYIRDFARLGAIARHWSEFFVRYAALLGPVSTMPPFSVGHDLVSADTVHDISHSLRLVVIPNLLGLPAAVVPVGLASGIPQAVQVIGPNYRDDICLDVAEQIENVFTMNVPVDPQW